MSSIDIVKKILSNLPSSESEKSSSSSSVSSSENHKQRPPIRKAPAQDFSLDLTAKSVAERSHSKSEESSDQSPKVTHAFKYSTRVRPEEVLTFEGNKDIMTHVESHRYIKQAKPLRPLVLKVNQTTLSASTLWDLLNTLNLKKCKSVSLTKCKNLNKATFNLLSVQIKRLKHLDLSDVTLQTRSSQVALARLILKNKDNLENLNLSNCNLNHKVLEAILQCSQLRSLNLSGCYYRTPDLEDFAEPSEAGVHNLAQETEANYAKTCSTFPLMLFISCLRLEHLNLSNFSTPFDHTKIDAYLKSDELKIPLRTFIYDDIAWVDATILQNLLQYLPHLETLSLNRSGNFTDLPYYPNSLPHLKHLSLSGQSKIPFDIFESDRAHFSKLESLDLSSCENYVSLRLSSFLLKKGHNLKNLNLGIKTFPYAHLIRMLKGIGPSQKEKQQYERLETVRKLLAIVLNGKITSDTHISHISLYDLLLEIKSELPANTKDSSKIEVAEKLWGVRLKLDALAKEKNFYKHNLLRLLREIQKIIKDDALAPLNLQEHLTKIVNLEKSAHDILSKHLKSMTPVQLAPETRGLGGQLKSLTIPAKFMTPRRIIEILSHCPQLETLNGLPINSSSENF